MNIVNQYYNSKKNYGLSKLRAEKIIALLGDVNNKKILDIGCSNGELGSLIKAKYDCQVHGCDLSKTAIEKTKKKYDSAFLFDVEEDNYGTIDTKYDCIIAAELIEHLFLPKKFLQNIKTLLTPGGYVILTTPNFLMWTFRLRMLFGEFEYKKDGFWDESHIHFFTYNSIKKIITECEYKIVEENNIFHRLIPDKLGELRPNLFAYQIILKLSK